MTKRSKSAMSVCPRDRLEPDQPLREVRRDQEVLQDRRPDIEIVLARLIVDGGDDIVEPLAGNDQRGEPNKIAFDGATDAASALPADDPELQPSREAARDQHVAAVPEIEVGARGNAVGTGRHGLDAGVAR